MIKKYSFAKDGETKLSPHFKVKEFRCKDKSDTILIDDRLPSILEKIRAHFRSIYPGATINIHSAYRTRSYNKAIGGASGSQHCLGTAIDFSVRIPNDGIVSPLEVYKALNGNLSLTPGKGIILGRHNGGLGKYGTFTHIDVREGASRWTK